MALLRVGPLSVPSPGEVVDAGRSALDWGGTTVALGASLPGRVDALVVEVERLVGVLGRLADRVDGVVDRTEAVIELSRGVADRSGAVVDMSTTVAQRSSELVDAAGETSTAAREMLDLYRPMLEHGAPLAQRFVDDLTPEEIDAAIKLVDQLPGLTEHMVGDIMPILETLDRVGPDLHELLDVTKDLRQGIAGIPGLSYLVKRGAGKDDQD